MKIAYINSYDYSSGAANSIRAQGFVDSLKVPAAVWVMSHHSYISKSWQALIDRTRTLGSRRLKALALGTAVKEWLGELPEPPDAVVMYGTDARFLAPTLKWTRQRGIPLFLDVVDWYGIEEASGFGEKCIYAINSYWSMPKQASKAAGSIVASKYLQDYFSERGVPSLRLPALIQLPDAESLGSTPPDEEMSIAYVGNPGRRDGHTIDNLKRLTFENSDSFPKLVIHLVGDIAEDVKSSTRVRIVYHGRMPRAAALGIVSRADFTVLQRPADRRFARAGFPSKVAESLLVGTPVLANRFGDIEEYVSDGSTGVLLDGHSYSDLRNGIMRAVNMRTRLAGRRTAIAEDAFEWFSPISQARSVREFLSNA